MNKKILAALFVLCSVGATFMACNSNEPDEAKAKNHDMTKPEYTIMFYTVGGGDLDYSIEGDLMRAMDALYPNDVSVRFFVQMKYSNEQTYWKKRKEKNPDADMSKYKLQGGEFSTVYRYELLPSMLSEDKKTMLKLPESAKYGNQGDQAAFYNPDSITSFINYCKAANPNADKYILILSDHGGGYSPLNDFDKSAANANPAHMPSIRRSVCFDPELKGGSITPLELKDGILKSNVKKFDLIFFDCCLLNIVDVICETTDIAKYTLASGHSTSGCDYGALVKELYLTVGGYNSQVDAFMRYTQNCADVHYYRYKNGSTDVRDYYIDWALTQTDQLPAMMNAMKTFTDAVCAYYDKETLSAAELLDKYQKAADAPWHYVDIYPYYDLAAYAYALAYVMNDQEVTNAYNNLFKTIDNAIIYHSYANNAKDNNLSYSINIGAKGYLRMDFNKEHTTFACFDKDGNVGFYNPNTCEIIANPGNEYASPKFAWKNSFEQTAFEKATGWTRWMVKNPAMPNNNPPVDDIWDTNGL